MDPNAPRSISGLPSPIAGPQSDGSWPTPDIEASDVVPQTETPPPVPVQPPPVDAPASERAISDLPARDPNAGVQDLDLSGLPDAAPLKQGVQQLDLSSLPDDGPAVERTYEQVRHLDPERAAKVTSISKQTGESPDVVDKNLDQMTKVLAGPPPMTFMDIEKNYPATNKFLLDPENMAAAHDDLHNVTKIERSTKDFSTLSDAYDALQSGLVKIGASLARLPALGVDVIAAKYIPSAKQQAPDWLLNNPIATYLDALSKQLAPESVSESVSATANLGGAASTLTQGRSALGNLATAGLDAIFARYLPSVGAKRLAENYDISGAIDEIKKGDIKRAGRLLFVQFAQNLPNQAAIIASSLFGGELMGLFYAGATTAADKNVEARDSKASPVAQVTDALANGTIEAGFEHLGTFGILHHWADSIGNLSSKATAREVFTEFAKSLAYSMAGEGNEEFWTSIAQDFSDYVTGVNPNGLSGMFQRAVDSGIIGASSGIGLTAPVGIAQGVAKNADIMREKRKTSLMRDFYTSLGQDLEASKLRERLPDKLREHADAVAKEGGVETVYVDAKAFEEYFQSKDISPSAAAQELGVLDSYNEAKSVGDGGDVRIPLGTWAQKMVGTEHYEGLADDVRLRQADMSANELKMVEKAMQAEAEKAKGVEAPAADSANAVGENIEGQLKAIGQSPEGGVLPEAFFRTMASRMGKDAKQLFDAYPLQVQKDGAAPERFEGAQVFDQGPNEQGGGIIDAVAAFQKRREVVEQNKDPKQQFLKWVSAKYGDEWLDWPDERVKKLESEFRRERQGVRQEGANAAAREVMREQESSVGQQADSFERVDDVGNFELYDGDGVYGQDGEFYSLVERDRGEGQDPEVVLNNGPFATEEEAAADVEQFMRETREAADSPSPAGAADEPLASTPSPAIDLATARDVYTALQSKEDVSDKKAAIKRAQELAKSDRPQDIALAARLLERIEEAHGLTKKLKAEMDELARRISEFLPIVRATRFGMPSGNLWTVEVTLPGGQKVQGVGASKAEARENAFAGGAQLEEYTPQELMNAKKQRQMLVVGSNAFMRERVPFFLLQNYDLHLTFEPQPRNVWRVGVISVSRTNPADAKYLVYEDQDVNKAVNGALQRVLLQRPTDVERTEPSKSDETRAKWFQNWIYRRPKISLRDVLALDKYDGPVEPVDPNTFYQSAAPLKGQGPGVPQTEFERPDALEIVHADEPSSRKEAAAHAKENFQGETFTNENTGWEIDVSGKGLRESFRGMKSEAATAALQHLDDLLRVAYYDRVSPPLDGDRNIKAYHYLYAPMQLGDDVHAIRITVRETNEGNKFYHEAASESVRPASVLVSEATEAAGPHAVNEPHSISLGDFEALINEERQTDPLFQSSRELRPELSNLLRRLSPELRDALAGMGASAESVPLDSNVDGTGAGSEDLSELVQGDESVEKKGGFAQRPSLLPVLAKMRAVIRVQPEILDAIVGLVPVDVVNNLFGSQGAAKEALHHEAMLQNGSAFDADLPVAASVETASPIRLFLREAAQAATEISRVAARAGLESPENFSASGASEGNGFGQGESPGGEPRARITFLPERAIITLLKKADASSFIHETGHYYLEMMRRFAADANAPEQIKNDWATIADYLGIQGERITREQHEKWAESIEQYVLDGNAPSSRLREAFERFRLWIANVYRTLTLQGVELTPEIRGVMDRMFATDQEIAAVQEEQQIGPLFPDAEAMGMQGAAAERYRKAVDDARLAAREQLTQKVMAGLKRQQEAAYKKARKRMKADVEKEVYAEPVYLALHALQRGTQPDGAALEIPPSIGKLKLDAKLLRKLFKPDLVKKLPKRISAKEGLHPDVVADLFGFRNGTELVAQLAAAQEPKALIERLTNSRMEKEFPTLLTPDELREEALSAVHNEDRSKLLRMELDHLMSENLPLVKDAIRRVSRRMPSDKEVRETARKIIARRTVSDLSPSTFQRAERAAAKRAGELLAKGDVDGAIQSKYGELLNNELYRAAVEARELVEKSQTLFGKVTERDENLAKTRDIDLVNAARALLAQVGLAEAEKRPDQYLEQMKAYDPDAYQAAITLVNSATERLKGDWRSLQFDDYVAVYNAVKALWDLSRSTRQIEIDGKKMDRKEAVAELVDRAAELTRDKPATDEYHMTPTGWDRTKRRLLGARAYLRRVESWADELGESFKTFIFRPVSEAAARYREAKVPFLEKYLAILKTVEKTLTDEKIRAPELVNRQTGEVTVFSGKRELLGAILHTGNQSNFAKLLRGHGWGDYDMTGALDTSQWDAFMQRMYREGTITKADMDFAQSVWDLHEEMKPLAQKAHKEMFGYYFEEITADPVTTPFGVYKGGYVPAVADPFLASDQQRYRDAEEQQGNSYMFPTTGRGFTKSRVEAYAAPLALDLGYMPAHIDKMLRFVHIEPAVKQVTRLVRDREMEGALNRLDPTVVNEMLMPWLQRAASQKIVTPSATGHGANGWDSFWRATRRRAGLQAMAVNVTNALQQLTGFSISMVKVGPTQFLKPRLWRDAFWSFLQQPNETADMIAEKSRFMRNRMENQGQELQRQIEDIILNPTKFDRARTFAEKHGHMLAQSLQSLVDTTTWAAAYNQAVEQGESEAEAIRLADESIRLTQGSPNAEDVSRFETGTPFLRLFTMFTGYFNMQANLLKSEFTKVVRDMGLRDGAGRAFWIYTMGFMLPAFGAELITQAMSGRIDGDDDDDYLNDIINLFFSSQLRGAAALVPAAGPAAMAGLNAFNDKWYDDRISVSPVVSMLESTVRLPLSAYKLATDENASKKTVVRDFLTAIGMLTGLPAAPLSRPLSYLHDVNEGIAEPANPVDFARGLITGKSGAPRK